MKCISSVLWEIPADLLNVVLKSSNLCVSPVKAAGRQSEMEQEMQKEIKRCRRSSALPAQGLCQCWNGAAGGGEGLHKHCLLSSSPRIHFQAITSFPPPQTESLVQGGLMCYHLSNHCPNTGTICCGVVCASAAMANAQSQLSCWGQCRALSAYFSLRHSCVFVLL